MRFLPKHDAEPGSLSALRDNLRTLEKDLAAAVRSHQHAVAERATAEREAAAQQRGITASVGTKDAERSATERQRAALAVQPAAGLVHDLQQRRAALVGQIDRLERGWQHPQALAPIAWPDARLPDSEREEALDVLLARLRRRLVRAEQTLTERDRVVADLQPFDPQLPPGAQAARYADAQTDQRAAAVDVAMLRDAVSRADRELRALNGNQIALSELAELARRQAVAVAEAERIFAGSKMLPELRERYDAELATVQRLLSELHEATATATAIWEEARQLTADRRLPSTWRPLYAPPRTEGATNEKEVLA